LHAREAEHFDALAARASEVPRYLARHETNLRRGLAEGRAPDRDVAAAFDRVLAGAAVATKALPNNARTRGASDAAVLRIADAAREAARAYESFAAFVRDAIAPAARANVLLGEDEV